MKPVLFSGCMLVVANVFPGVANADMPEAIAATGQVLVATLHAEGAQVYECKADNTRKLAWQFREPIATLVLDGKTVGRHYAGPNWELADGSAVSGKVSGRAAGATPADIPTECSPAFRPSSGSIQKAVPPTGPAIPRVDI
jgi:hypothetical protein